MTTSASVMGVSLKMYFGQSETTRWCEQVADIARRHEAVVSGAVATFVLPTFPAIALARVALDGTAVGVGAQDLHWEDSGAWTGEVSGPVLRELGVEYVEVGHAERRIAFGESDDVVAAKTAAAMRNGLVPVVCVGEPDRVPADTAAAWCVAQVRSALARISMPAIAPSVLVAYEPLWAIGASRPADVDHVALVAERLRKVLADLNTAPGSGVLYGGSAGPGLYTELDGAVDGLFLGRFAHDPVAFAQVLDEVVAVTGKGSSWPSD